MDRALEWKDRILKAKDSSFQFKERNGKERGCFQEREIKPQGAQFPLGAYGHPMNKAEKQTRCGTNGMGPAGGSR